MLNDFLAASRGLPPRDLAAAKRHPDLKDCRRVPTLLVRLDPDGGVAAVRPISPDVKLWTLRDGQHNSFPFVQPKQPLWALADDDERRKSATNRRNTNRHGTLLELATDVAFNSDAFAGWPGDGLLKRVRERRQQVTSLVHGDGAAVPAAMDRFLAACQASDDGPARLLAEVCATLSDELQYSASDEFLNVAVAILIEGTGAFFIDAIGDDFPSVIDVETVGHVSAALSSYDKGATEAETAVCELTGNRMRLIDGKFPQPNLPILGQTFLFARNRDTAANGRYGRFSNDTMRVGHDTAVELAAAAEVLADDTRKGKTWRAVPGETPKQSDLLVAFVEGAADAPIADTVAREPDEPHGTDTPFDAITEFETLTEQVVNAIGAELRAKVRDTRVRLFVLRKLDPANRKVMYTGRLTVGALLDAAEAWAAGERNTPDWLRIPVFRKGDREPVGARPPHIAPLGVIRFSRQDFGQRGAVHQEVQGIPAAEAMWLFLGAKDVTHETARRRVRRILRLVLARRGGLAVGVAHALRQGPRFGKHLDRWESLRTATILGLLLHKLHRKKETYMHHPAFQLGQLLAVADVVHAGYCADVRGQVPPSLLGNQMFTVAQNAPIKALAMLCRRWKPYAAWAKKAVRSDATSRRANELVDSPKRDEKQRGWDIRNALSHAHGVQPIAADLTTTLEHVAIDEQFRAEVLLGYMAGLPKKSSTDDTSSELHTSEG